MRTNLDGDESTIILQRDDIESLVIDRYQNRIYWVEEYHKIYHSELDGSDIRSLNLPEDNDKALIFNLHGVDLDYVYYNRHISWSKNEYLRMNKLTGKIDEELKLAKKKVKEGSNVLFSFIALLIPYYSADFAVNNVEKIPQDSEL